MPQSVKAPAACKPQELENFKTMLLSSELEGEDGLEERIAQAEWLAFQYDDNKQLIAIAALKRPVDGYRKGIFKKAGLLEQAGQYPLEFGWVVIRDEYHGRGVGSALLGRLLQKAGPLGIFAVARSSNQSIAASLLKQGFLASGEPYSRRGHRYTYQVFLRAGAGQSAAETGAGEQ
jgi:GNAT superfamily N-acetyltransferase